MFAQSNIEEPLILPGGKDSDKPSKVHSDLGDSNPMEGGEGKKDEETKYEDPKILTRQ